MSRWLLYLGCLIFSVNALAATGPWGQDGPASARLITPENGLAGKEELLLGLQIKLEPGWKTYWKTPGAAGAAPTLDLNHPTLESEPIWYWPAPKRFNLLGFQSYGYSDEVVLPIRYKLNASTQRLELDAQANIYACNNLCLPLSIPLKLDLTGDQSTDWSSQRLLNQYLARVPVQLSPEQMQPEAVVDNRGLYLSLKLERPSQDADLFVENYDLHDWPDPKLEITDNHVQAWWQAPEGVDVKLPDNPLQFTYVDSLQAYQAEVEAKNGARPASSLGLWGWLSMLVMAWLGGLILNVMPCVLPVLSMKLMHLNRAVSMPVRETRIQLLLIAAGVMSFFWVLALGLGVLKAAGYYAGWGIQFQSPYFLLFMLLLILLFSANLLGWFEFSLPTSWQTSLASAGDEHKHSPRLASFMQGMVATLLATPCSAPFLGTAVAFAMGQGWREILVIFTALGLGLSTPYWLLLIWPGMIQRLPKPGRWMQKVRRLLALGMLLTALWVLWLLSNHFSVALLALIAALSIGWLLLWQPTLKKWRPASLWLAALLILSPLTASNSVESTDFKKETFQPQRIDEMVAEGKMVLVDITADWCITCKYNKTIVLDSSEVRQLLQQYQVTFMQGDWTLPDPVIEAFLQKHQRSGIPFNAIYGPGSPGGVLLPELLTADNLRNAVVQAAAK